MLRIDRDAKAPALFQFGFVCFQGFAGRKSFPPSQSAPRARRLDRRAREGEHSGDRARPCDARPRARCTVARPRRYATAAHMRSTTRLAGGCSHEAWVSGGAWPRRILVIGGRRKRIARFHIFRNRISQISKSGPQMRFRTRLLVPLHRGFDSLNEGLRLTDVRHGRIALNSVIGVLLSPPQNGLSLRLVG